MTGAGWLMRKSAPVITARRLRKSAVIAAAVCPFFRRSSHGSKIAHSCVELD